MLLTSTYYVPITYYAYIQHNMLVLLQYEISFVSPLIQGAG